MRIVAWWKVNNLLMSTAQLRESGLYPQGQLKLWIEGKLK